MSFCESNRYKWDYVAEIFVDLQDLHSNDEIPGIINDINRYLKYYEKFKNFIGFSTFEMPQARALKVLGIFFLCGIHSLIEFQKMTARSQKCNWQVNHRANGGNSSYKN